MPVRNAYKDYDPNGYYHIYTRGIDKRDIFLDEDDRLFLLSLFKRYLSVRPAKSKARVLYPHYYGRLTLLSYCLMDNHIHLFVQQHDRTAMQEFMKSLLASYTTYFNKRHTRFGPLFQSRYLASRVSSESYFIHITRYIHLNPKNWRTYPYSSIRFYTGEAETEWLNPQNILSMFQNGTDYLSFVSDYEGYKRSLDDLKWELANSKQLDTEC